MELLCLECFDPQLEDGTLRKAPHLWREWGSKLSMELHADQLAVALRAARLLRPGGRMVYRYLEYELQKEK